MIGYICKSSENLSFTVNRFQKAEITQYFHFLTPLFLSDLNIGYFRCNIFAIKPSTRGIVENEIDLVFIVLHMPIILACNKAN